MKKKMFMIYSKFIDVVTVLAVFAFFVSVSALDSESLIPAIVCIASIAWIALYSWTHGLFE